MTKLVDGRIPVGEACPFKGKCEIGASGACYHTGKFHQSPFSCATARAFDLIDRYEQEPKLLAKGGSNGNRKGEALSS